MRRRIKPFEYGSSLDPVQIVESKKTDQKRRTKSGTKRFDIGLLILTLILYIGGATFSWYMWRYIPKHLDEVSFKKIIEEDLVSQEKVSLFNISNLPEDEFSSHRAFFHLNKMAHKLRYPNSKQLRVGGQYFYDYAKSLIPIAERHGYNMYVEWQTVSGSYALQVKSFSDVTLGNIYSDVENIVVLIEPRLATNASQEIVDKSKEALVINAHYDSAAGSPGASDDASQCAVMAEVMTNIISVPAEHSIRRSLLLLFNGAEETFLQGSHGFVTKHQWIERAKILINLESSGAGHKSIMLWCGPYRQLGFAKVYAKYAIYPHAKAEAQDVFESGLVPGETDHRIFRENGKIFGYDFANYYNGYVYHTLKDDIAHVKEEFLHQTGVNTLNLVRALIGAESDENFAVIFDPANTGKAHFFDIFGLTTVVYSESVGYVFHSIALLVSAFCCWKFYKKSETSGSSFQLASIGLLLSFLSFLAVSSLSARFAVQVLQRPYAWFGQHWIAFALFLSMPVVIFTVVLDHFSSTVEKHDEKSNDIVFDSFSHAMICVLSIFLIVMMVLRLRMAYIPAILTTSVSAAKLFIPNQLWMLQFAVWSIPSLVIGIPTSFLLTETFTPIMGRAGVNADGDLVVAIVYGFSFFAHFVLPLVPLIAKFKKEIIKLMRGAALAMFVASSVYVFLYRGIPYSEDHPKRVMIQHFYNADSNYSAVFATSFDPLSVKTVLPKESKILGPASDYRWGKLNSTAWELIQPLASFVGGVEIDSQGAVHEVPRPQMYLEESTVSEQKGTRFLRFKLSTKKSIQATVHFDAPLLNWSIAEAGEDVPSRGSILNGYFIKHVGSDEKEWSFWIELNSTSEVSFDVTASRLGRSKFIEAMVDTLPLWASPIVFKTTAASYTF